MRAAPTSYGRSRLNQWQDAAVRQAYIDSFVQSFEDLLSNFSWVEVILDTVVKSQAIKLMGQHGFGSHDAIHLASVLSAGIENMASFDETFRRVNGLFLWNDQIHSS